MSSSSSNCRRRVNLKRCCWRKTCQPGLAHRQRPAVAAETREQLETLRLRAASCGAVLNRAPASIFQNKFRRWFNYAAILFALNFSMLHAAEEAGSQTATNQTPNNLSFSVVSPAQRAACSSISRSARATF